MIKLLFISSKIQMVLNYSSKVIAESDVKLRLDDCDDEQLLDFSNAATSF